MVIQMMFFQQMPQTIKTTNSDWLNKKILLRTEKNDVLFILLILLNSVDNWWCLYPEKGKQMEKAVLA